MDFALDNLKSKLGSKSTIPDQAKNSLKYAWPALRLALTVFEKTLDGAPIPGLKGTVGGILELAKTEEALIQNTEDVLELQTQITTLTCILKRWGDADELPLELASRINTFFSGLSDISTQLHSLTSRGSFRRFFTTQDDANKISRLIRDIDQLLQRFQLDGISSIEIAVHGGVHGIQEAVKEENSKLTNALTDAIRSTNSENPIWSLPRARGARFDANTRQDESGCLEQTRVDLLQDINHWVSNHDKGAPWMFVLQGLAGTGKSTIARTVCETLSEQRWLGASFFFSRNEASCSNPFLFFTTVAYQLAFRYPQFNNYLTKILKEDPDVVELTLDMQLKRLVLEPLLAAADGIGSSPIVVIVDAIDECSNYRAQIMSLLCSIGSKLPIPFKLFVSLRPEYDLQAALTSQNIFGGAHSFILHDVDSSIVHGDIERFLRFRLSKVAAKYPNIIDPTSWPSTDDISALARKSDKLFIFAATVVKFVEDAHSNPQDRLDIVLRKPFDRGHSPYKHLDQLYQQVLESALPETAHKLLFEQFRTIVGAIMLLYDPLDVSTLGRLLQKEAGEVRMALLHLHSLVIAPDDNNEIHLIHPSFRDFMTGRCPKESRYFINSTSCHRQLVLMCFKTMEKALKRDVCDIRDMWKLNEEVNDLNSRINKIIPANVQYACRHWATHLSESLPADHPVDDVVLSALMSFASLHLLHWLEVLSLIGRLDEAIHALRHAQHWAAASSRAPKELRELVYDGERFALEFFTPISLGALHIYHSALPFTARSQLIRQVYHYESGSAKVLSGLPPSWNPWLFAMHGHSNSVLSVGFSPDGSCIASASSDHTVRIWDASTSVHLSTLKGHSNAVTSVTFSPDGSCIASGSRDNTVRIWNAKTSVHLLSLMGHSGGVYSVTFSPDGTRIAFGSHDQTIRIWDTKSNMHLSTLGGHSDLTVRIWDTKSGHHLSTLEGHSHFVSSVVFSPDNSRIASGCYDKTVRIWDAKNFVYLSALKGHSDFVSSIVFSPDGGYIASGSCDRTVRIWGIKPSVHLSTLGGHSDAVISVAFSPDGRRIVSGSRDQTVRIWDARSSVHLSTFEAGSVTSIAFSPDGRRIVAASRDQTARIWDVKSGARLSTFECRSGLVTSIAFSPDGSRIIAYSQDATQIWDANTAAEISLSSANTTSNSPRQIAENRDVGTSTTRHPPSRPLGHAVYDIHIMSSPGWLLVTSGNTHIVTRFWLPVGTFSHSFCHSFHGNSAVIGTDRGLVMTLELPTGSG